MGFNKDEKKRIIEQVQQRLAERIGEMGAIGEDIASRESAIDRAVAEVLQIAYDNYDQSDVDELAALAKRDLLQYGAIQPFLDDDEITEIVVNSYDKVFVERNGILERVEGAVFDSEQDVRRIVDRIASELNKHCDTQEPRMDARLRDGSRVAVVIPPLSRFGTSLSIRKFPKHRLDADDLVDMGACSENLMRFLACMVEAGCNILVSGGTGTGKTTLLNILCSFIPENERVITIEDTAELKLEVEDWASWEARTPNSDGQGAVTIHDLVVSALRHRPDRIIVGECRADETVEMLQAMNTGHDGSLTTIHANDPRAAFLRIETMVQATQNLSVKNIDMQIASAIQIVVQLSRYNDGSRKISEVMALTGTMEGDMITATPIFRYAEAGYNTNGELVGWHIPCGANLPEQILARIERSGAEYDPSWIVPSSGVM